MQDATLVRAVPSWVELDAAKAELSAYGKVMVETLEGQAMAYVWGFQDAKGRDAHDTGYSVDFGRAYGMHAARYEAGVIHFRHNIADAFRRWSAGEHIEKGA